MGVKKCGGESNENGKGKENLNERWCLEKTVPCQRHSAPLSSSLGNRVKSKWVLLVNSCITNRRRKNEFQVKMFSLIKDAQAVRRSHAGQ